MDPEQLARLNEKDRQDIQKRFEIASNTGKFILNLLLAHFIGNHDSRYEAMNIKPPSLIDNYKLDTSPYSPEVDVEFEVRLSRYPQKDQAVMRGFYQNSTPEEKVLLRQALVLNAREEPTRAEQQGPFMTEAEAMMFMYQEQLKLIPPEELKDMKEFYEQTELVPFVKREEMEAKKMEEWNMKWQECPMRSYTYEEPKRVEQWNTNTYVIKESQDVQSAQNQWKPQQSYEQWKPITYEEPKRVDIKEEKTIVTERVITMEEWNARQRNQEIQHVTSNYQYDHGRFGFSERDRILQEMIFNRPTPLN